MWKRLICLAFVFGLAATAPPAWTQSPCAPHKTLTEKLIVDFRESLVGRGLQSSSRLFEVWRSTEDGTWTILLLTPEGTACIVAAGFAWTDEVPRRPSVDAAHRR